MATNSPSASLRTIAAAESILAVCNVGRGRISALALAHLDFRGALAVEQAGMAAGSAAGLALTLYQEMVDRQAGQWRRSALELSGLSGRFIAEDSSLGGAADWDVPAASASGDRAAPVAPRSAASAAPAAVAADASAAASFSAAAAFAAVADAAAESDDAYDADDYGDPDAAQIDFTIPPALLADSPPDQPPPDVGPAEGAPDGPADADLEAFRLAAAATSWDAEADSDVADLDFDGGLSTSQDDASDEFAGVDDDADDVDDLDDDDADDADDDDDDADDADDADDTDDDAGLQVASDHDLLRRIGEVDLSGLGEELPPAQAPALADDEPSADLPAKTRGLGAALAAALRSPPAGSAPAPAPPASTPTGEHSPLRARLGGFGKRPPVALDTEPSVSPRSVSPTSSVGPSPELFSARSRLRDALSRAPVRSSPPDEPQTLPPSAIRPFTDEPSVPPASSAKLRAVEHSPAAADALPSAAKRGVGHEPDLPTQHAARGTSPKPASPVAVEAAPVAVAVEAAPVAVAVAAAPVAAAVAAAPAADVAGPRTPAAGGFEIGAPRTTAKMPTIAAPAAGDSDFEMPSVGLGDGGGLHAGGVDGDTDLALGAVHDDDASVSSAGGGFRVEFESAADDDDLGDDEDDVPQGPQLTDDADQTRTSTVVASPTDNKALSIEARQLVARAQAAERDGDLRLAVGLWSDALDFLAEDGQIYMARGRASLSLGDYGGAMSDFQRAEDLEPQSADPVYEMGNLFYDRKDWARAIEYYDNALELDAAHALARCKRGLSHYYNHDPKQAFQDLQRAHALDPNIAGIRRYVQMAVKAMERDGR